MNSDEDLSEGYLSEGGLSEGSQNESGDYPDQSELGDTSFLSEELESITETLKSLTDAKYSLINTFVSKKIDPVVFFSELGRINNEIREVGNAKSPLEAELATKEFEYSYQLERFAEILKTSVLSITQRRELSVLNEQLKSVRSIYSKHFKPDEVVSSHDELVSPDEPILEESIINKIKENYYKDFPMAQRNVTSPLPTPEDIQLNWVNISTSEINKMYALAKTNRIHIPKRREYQTDSDFEFAISLFYKSMLRYLPISIQQIGVSSIKTVELVSEDFPYRLFQELKEDVANTRNVGKLIILSDSEHRQMLQRIAQHGRNYISPEILSGKGILLNEQVNVTPRQKTINKKPDKKSLSNKNKVIYFVPGKGLDKGLNSRLRQYFLLKKLRKKYTIRLKGIILDNLSDDILNKYRIFKNILINTDSIQLEKIVYNECTKKRSRETLTYYSLLINRLIKLFNDTPDLVNKVITRTITRKQLLHLLVPQRVAPVEKVIKIMKQLSLDPSIVKFEQLTLGKKSEDTTEAVLYNPYTGGYSREAYNGYLFQVYRLNKNVLTGQPYTITVPYEELNKRTGQTSFVMKTIEQPGPTPYIKFPLDMGNTIKTVWREVNINDVKNYPLNYDTCKRFTNQSDCISGKGLGNYNCVFKDNKCKTSYLN